MLPYLTHSKVDKKIQRKPIHTNHCLQTNFQTRVFLKNSPLGLRTLSARNLGETYIPFSLCQLPESKQIDAAEDLDVTNTIRKVKHQVVRPLGQSLNTVDCFSNCKNNY